jgi:Flp pilus assembly protein TadG
MFSAMGSMSRFSMHASRRARNFLKDRSGLAAVEFAFIVPVMLVMFFGTMEFSQGIGTNRKVTIMARSLSDLTSQNTSVTTAQLNNFFAAATAILTPYSVTPVRSTISELYIDPATQAARVQWSVGSAPRGQSTIVVIPSQLIARDAQNNVVANQYLIYSEVTYQYVPTIGYVMAPSGVNLRDDAYTRPRQSTCVMYNTQVCTTF